MGLVKAPFPWFGGKSKVAPIVWERFGAAIRNYVEPFFGSGAVLLGRPGWAPGVPWIETINDLDGFVANFWRAIRSDPEAVASWANWPANENDLHARYVWLKERRALLSRRLEGDPEYFDVKIAGWWVWGLACWIGTGFCYSGRNGPWNVVRDEEGLPQLLHLGNAGQGVTRQQCGIYEWFAELSQRLQSVRVCSGDWQRILSPSPTTKLGMTGVFLDPPYSEKADRDNDIYAVDSMTLANDVREWCVKNGENPDLKIALCGYIGEHDASLIESGWTSTFWRTQEGFGSQGTGKGRRNAGREVLWWSPHCRKSPALTLFGDAAW